jgi:outer membrane protein TolC
VKPAPVSLAVALAVLATRAVGAQVVRVPSSEVLQPRVVVPAKLVQPSLSLAQAVELTLRHDPEIGRATQALAGARGRRQAAAGIFDALVRVGPTFGYTQQPIAPFLRDQETATREILRIIADEFTTLTSALNDLVARRAIYRPRCPDGLSLTAEPLLLDRRDPGELALLGVNRDLRVIVVSDLARAVQGIDLSTICISTGEADVEPEVFREFWQRIDQSGGYGLQGILTSVSQIPHEARALEAKITDTVATRARLALDRLGPVPLDQLVRSLLADISLVKPLRNGVFVSGALTFQSEEQAYRDKPLDPSFGGLGMPPRFPASATFAAQVPLGKGRGRVVASAPERAALLASEAQREETRFTLSEQVLQTVLAYWDLVAAHETVALLEQSAARQQRIAALTEQQVQAGDLPAMERDRARGRAAIVASQLAAARAALERARGGVARAIGADADVLAHAPVPVDRFPSTRPPVPPLPALLEQAAARRRDLRALASLRDASAVLARAARVDLRRRVDLAVVGGLSNYYESPFFRYLPDEVDPIYSDFEPRPVRPTPVRFFSPRGFYRSLTGRWEPFLTASFTFDLPLANNVATGRAVQTQATLERSRLQAADLARVIRENVLGVAGALARAGDALERWETAVAHDEATVAATLERFGAGEVTLVDTLLTEEILTRDQLELVRARQVYWSLLARLRFETGTLVDFEGENTPAEAVAFDPTWFVGK